MKKEIVNYYDELAKRYDENRFSNSYGKYINQQENRILKSYLNKNETDLNLDVACGTGRFLDYSDYGVDISHEMVKVAQDKFPQKKISVADAEALPFSDSFFNNVTAFHLFMHLDFPMLKNILAEINRVTATGGTFIFDVPSLKRRKITGYKATSWHGGHQIKVSQMKEIAGNSWELVSYHGIAFLPIHRIPKKIRPLFIGLDNLLCRSIFKEYGSHLIFVLRKK